MSAGSALGASEADQPSESAVPSPSDTVIAPAAAQVDADTAAVDTERKSETTESGKTAVVASGDGFGTIEARAASATVKPLRKTCILKLDGCHYTIGRNALLTLKAMKNRLFFFSAINLSFVMELAVVFQRRPL